MPSATLPDRIPIFPLPNVVLFPHVFLPLHIFEPRYREMVADAIGGDRVIGMVLLRDGWRRHAGPNPPIFPIGCAGRITHVAPLPDGRYNIVLRGIERFRVQDEDHSRSYRIARVDALPDGSAAAGGQRHLQAGRRRLEELLERQAAATVSASRIPRGMADGELVNILSQYLELEPIERQALLEKDGPCERCAALIDLLEMRVLANGKAFSGAGLQ